MTCLHRKEAVTTDYLGDKAKELHFKQLCFVSKEKRLYVFHLPRITVSRQYPQLQLLRRKPEASHSTSTVNGHHSQTDLGTSPSSAIFTGTQANESDLDTLYKREHSNNSYFRVTNSEESESTFLGCGPSL